MNRDEAERCVDLAQASIERGDTARALRLLRRSLAMHPTERARALLLSLEAETPTTPNPQPQEQTPPPEPEPQPQEQPQQQQQQEDDEDVARVLRCSEDYYAVFGMERGATTEEIKRRYRRLALKMHPDRNSSPHAEDAFKVLGRAYACLSSVEKRRVYDTQGIDPDACAPPPPRRTGPTAAFRRAPGAAFAFGDDLDADDLFRFFFGVPPGMGDPFAGPFGPSLFGYPGGTRVYMRQRRPRHHDTSDSDDDEDNNSSGRGGRGGRGGRPPRRANRYAPRPGGFWGLVQALVPLALLLVLFVLLTRGLGGAAEQQQRLQRERMQAAAEYSLQPRRTHPYRYTTSALGVPYFTRNEALGTRTRERIERNVDTEYLQGLSRACQWESANRINRGACERARSEAARWAAATTKTTTKQKTSTATGATGATGATESATGENTKQES